jgi:hypothetical protein
MFNAQSPTPYFKNYATLAGLTNCKTDDPSGRGRSAVGIYVGGAGALTLRPKGTTGSADQAITATAGLFLSVEFDQIAAGGAATNVVVFWSRAAS